MLSRSGYLWQGWSRSSSRPRIVSPAYLLVHLLVFSSLLPDVLYRTGSHCMTSPLHQRYPSRKEHTLDPLPLPSPVPLFFASHSATFSFEGSRLPSFLSLSVHTKVYLNPSIQNSRSLLYNDHCGLPQSDSGQALGRKKTLENVSYVIRLRSRSRQPKASPARRLALRSRSHGYAIHRVDQRRPHVKPRPSRACLLPRRRGLSLLD